MIVEYDEEGFKKGNFQYYKDDGKVQIFFRNSWAYVSLYIDEILLRLLDNTPGAETRFNRFLNYLEKEGVEINPGESIKGTDCSKKIIRFCYFGLPDFLYFWKLGFKRLFYPLSVDVHSGDTYQKAKEDFNHDF